jgi:hypothetical protein
MGVGAGVGAEKCFCDETLVGENERTVSILGISSCSLEKKISNILPGELIMVTFKESCLTGAILLLSSVEEENTVAVVGEEAEGAFFKAGK